MIQVNIHEAKTKLSHLLNRVSGGEEVIIAKSGNPIARILPYHRPLDDRHPGLDAGLVSIADDFDASLHDDLIEEFEK